MFSLKTILLPVDFSETCSAAAHYAKALASRFRSRLVLLHVLPPLHIPYGGLEVVPTTITEIFAEARTRAEAQLETFLGEIPSSAAVERVVSEGNPTEKIVTYAHDKGVDLIVMPTHGYGPYRRFILGSVVAKVLHDSDRPIFTGVHLEETPHAQPVSFNKIACAVDFGPRSEKVLDWASAFAAEFAAQLLIFHVTPSLGVAVTESPETDPGRELARQASRDIEDLQRKAGTTAKVMIESGDISKALYDLAALHNVDLLVIGRASEKGIVGRLRANAYAIIRAAPCPVVSV